MADIEMTSGHPGAPWLDPQARLRLALEYSGVGDWTWDAATDQVDLSPRACEIFDLPGGSPTTWSAMRELLHPDDAERARTAVEHSVATGTEYDIEYRVRLRSGGVRWVSARGRAVYSSTGEEVGMVGLVQDITDRKRGEQMLRETEARFRTVADDAPVMIWVTGPDGNCTYVNRQWRDVTGTSLDQNLGLGWVNSLHPEDRDQSAALFLAANANRSNVQIEYRLRRHDGVWRWALDSAVPRIGADGEFLGYIGSVVDISDRKQYEDALAASEARFRSLVNTLPQLVWTCTPDGFCDWLNRRWLEYTGVEQHKQIGYGWLNCVHPEDRERIAAEWSKASSAGGPYDVEFRIRAADGAYRWFKTRAVALRNERGEIVKWVGTNTDVEDQKRTESALLLANFDLSQFAYSASHDLQEPLRTVVLYSQLLKKRHAAELPAGAAQLIDVIERSGLRMSALVKDLLAYTQTASHATAAPSISDAGEVVEAVLADMRAAIDATKATVTWSDLPAVGVALPHLHMLFMNLLSNAIKYRTAKRPVISIGADGLTDRWLFTVADNGIGIDPQYHEQIFGMFKRLHSEQYPGTGMGLAICKKIVEHYGGRIWIESSPGQGTQVRFTLPHAASQPDTLKNE